MAGDTKRFPAALAEEYTVVDAQMLDHSLQHTLCRISFGGAIYDPSLISRFFFLLQFSPIYKITFASVHTNEEGDYSCCTNLEGYFQCIFSTPSHKYIATYITKHASTH
jgi:hypothetical protein